MSKRILIVEDDAGLAKLLADNLGIDGFEVKWTPDPREALASCETFDPDLVLLDVMLPGQNGFEMVGPLREAGLPVIMVSAHSQRADKIRGLELGADDYVTKPFDFEELVARIHAVLRRRIATVDRLTLGAIVIDFNQLTATRHGEDIHLTHREFELLRYLADRPGITVRRDELLSDVWGVADGSTTRSVDFAIARLRKKIEDDPHHPRFIRTAHRDGYCLATTT